MSFLDNENFAKNNSLANKLLNIVENSINDTQELNELINNMTNSALIVLGIKTASEAIELKEILVKYLWKKISSGLVKSNVLTTLVTYILKGVAEEAPNAYMHILYRKFIEGLNEKSLVITNSSLFGYITSNHISQNLMTSTIIKQYIFHSTKYFKAMAFNSDNWRNGINFNDRVLLNQYEISDNLIEYKEKTMNIGDKAMYVKDIAIQSALYVPYYTSNTILKYNLYDVFNGTVKDPIKIDNYLNSIANIVTFFNTNIDAMEILARYQKRLVNMLSSKFTYNAIAYDNKLHDNYQEEVIKLKIRKDFLDLFNIYTHGMDEKQKANYYFIIGRGLTYEHENKIPFLTKDFLRKLDKKATRKDYMINILKAIKLNPYADISFLTKLITGEYQNSFSDIDAEGLTLNEKIWLLYGVNKNIIIGYDNQTLQPIKYISRKEAISLIGKAISQQASKNPDVIQENNEAKTSNTLKYLKINDFSYYDNLKTQNLDQYNNIGIAILNEIFKGSPDPINDGRLLNLESDVTMYEVGVLSLNLYKTLDHLSMINDYVGNPFDNYLKNKGLKRETDLQKIVSESKMLTSIPTITSNQTKKIKLITSIEQENLDLVNITWTPNIGKILDYENIVEDNGKISSIITYLAPGFTENFIFPIDVHFSTIYGKIAKKSLYVNIKPYEDYQDTTLDTNSPSSQLSATYIRESDKFRINWKGNSVVDQVKVYYSYDQSTWNELFTQSNNEGAKIISVVNSKDHNKVYFKIESIDTSTNSSNISNILESSYAPQKPYVEKSTEKPSTPQLYHLSGTRIVNYVDLRWKRVNDSHYNDNVDYYEVKYADNIRFENSQIVNAGNNAAGENLYESCSYRVANLQNEKRYYFRVRATNQVGTSTWSATESIEVDYQEVPYFDSYYYPEDGSIIGLRPTLKWRAYDKNGDDLEYYLVFGESADAMYRIKSFSEKGEANWFDFETDYYQPLRAGTKYYWQVWVREKGRITSDYGGEYIKSPIHNFTIPEGIGPDLSIDSAVLISELRPDHEAIFKLTVRNQGSENALGQFIQAYYKKGENISKFIDGSYMMPQDLAPGESIEVEVPVKFKDDVTITSSGKEYDNVLIEGDSYVVFDMPYRQEIDANYDNDRKEVKIHYENQGRPEFTHFSVVHQSWYDEHSYLVRGRIGDDLVIHYRAVDDMRITKVTIEYRLNEADSWKTLKEYNHDSDIVSEDFTWSIPNDSTLITNKAQVRVRAYENDTSYSEKVSYPFPIFSNNLKLSLYDTDKISYKVGDVINIGFNIENDYGISEVLVSLEGGKTTQVYHKFLETGFVPDGFLNVQIPLDNRYIKENARLKFQIYDIAGNEKVVYSNLFNIKPNTELGGPFGNFIDVYNQEYTQYPSGSTHQRTDNGIAKLFIDDNDVVHMIVSSTAWWWGQGDSSMSRHFRFYYITYNYNTKQISEPVLIYDLKKLNSGNLPSKFLKDFTVIDGIPYIMTFDTSGEKLELLHLVNGDLTTQEISTNRDIDNIEFVELANKVYVKYRHFPSNEISDRRIKVMQIYPSIGTEHNLIDEYLSANVRIYNNFVHFYSLGVMYDVDEDLNVITSTRREVTDSDNVWRAFGNTKIYDNSYIDSFLDSNKTVWLIKNNLNKIKIFDINDSFKLSMNNYLSRGLAVYPDMTIIGYSAIPNGGGSQETKVQVFYFDTNETISIKVNQYGSTTTVSDFNKNKIMAISNIDRGGAFLAVGDFSKNTTVSLVKILNTEASAERGSTITLNWEVTNSDNLIKYEVYHIVNGQEMLLDTIDDVTQTSMQYGLNHTVNKVDIKIVAYNSSGNSSYAILPLKIIDKVTFTSFAVDKYDIQDGEKLNFSWSADDADETTGYTIYMKYVDQSEDILDGLVAHYEFEGNPQDSSGNGNDGNENRITYVDGIYGKAIQFYGTNYIKGDIVNYPMESNERTVCAWVSSNDNDGMEPNFAVSYGSSTDKNAYGLFEDGAPWIDTNHWFTYTHCETEEEPCDIDSLVDVKENQWQFVCSTYKSGKITNYIDGILKNTANVSINTIGDKFYIGTSPMESYNFKGKIDDVRVYNRSLSDIEVKKLFDRGENRWQRILNLIGQNSKSYLISNIVGDVKFKIISGSSSMELDNTVTVQAEILKFKNELFTPSGTHYGKSPIQLQWHDTLENLNTPYTVWVKKEGESEFQKIGETTNKFYEYKYDLNGVFKWKVSAEFNSETVSSNEIEVIPTQIESPNISSLTFAMENDKPVVSLVFSDVEADEYIIERGLNGSYIRLETITTTSYKDDTVDYAKEYSYRVYAVKEGIKFEPGEIKNIYTALNEGSNITITTPNYQVISGSNITVAYVPTETLSYEFYEVMLGTSSENLQQYVVTSAREVSIEGLDYSTTYYIEVYAIDYIGNRLSSVPAKLVFTTGFDNRNITQKPSVTVEEVNYTQIAISWNSVENADEYYICRSDNGLEFECFDKTEETIYYDDVNIEQGNQYMYKVIAINGNNKTVSDVTENITIPMDNYTKLYKDTEELTFDVIKGTNADSSNIISDLNLITLGKHGSQISWESTNSSALNASTGKIIRPTDNDIGVDLIALLRYEDINETVIFSLLVKVDEVKDTDNDGIPDNIDIDDDNDGMPDSFELLHGLDPLDNSDKDSDFDGDGVSNYDEYINGTNPDDGTDTLPAPTNLTFSDITKTTVTLKWRDSGDYERGYKIYRRIQGEEWLETPIVALPEDTTMYIDSNLTSGTTYEYMIKATSNFVD